MVSPTWTARVRRGASTLVKAGSRFIDVEAYRLAASLSFYGLSSMLPLLLVAFGAGDLVLGDSHDLRQELISMLNVTDSPALRSLILDTVDGAGKARDRSSWSIGLGLFGAVFGASGIFLELDATMGKLFRVAPVKRSIGGEIKLFLRDRSVALVLVMGTCLLLLFGMVVLSALELVASQVRLPSDVWPGLLTYLGTFVLTATALTLCYRVLPAPRVGWGSALWGGALAATLLALVRWPLSWGLTQLTSYSTYGVIGALLVLVTWFYVANSILLLGAALTALLNETKSAAGAPSRPTRDAHNVHGDPSAPGVT